MNRESLRRPSPCTLAAAAALAFAATPIADAAPGKRHPPPAVAHARYADEAGRVGGYRVSYVPRPNTLVPLDSGGRLPVSVLPRGILGQGGSGARVPGPPGPPGPSGLDAPGVVRIVYQADGTSTNPTNGAAEAVCPAGTKVLGGGFNDLTRTIPALSAALPSGSVDEVQENDPFARSDGSSGWRVRIVNVPSPVMVTKTQGANQVVPNTLAPGSTYFQSYAICG